MLVIVLALLIVVVALADAAAIARATKRDGMHGLNRSGPLDRWCERRFGAWWGWRPAGWTIYAGVIAWLDTLSGAVAAGLLLVIGSVVQRIYADRHASGDA